MVHSGKQRINKFWRVIATGIAFSVFGIGGIILPLIATPIIYLSSSDPFVRECRAKLFVHYIMRGFVELMRMLGILTYSVGDIDQYNRSGQLILANHPTLIDVVFLIGFIRQADCVIKSSLRSNPFTKIPTGLARYIANGDPESVIEEAAASLGRGNSLIIFPEGTRTTPGEALKMQRGAANIALRAGIPITPVVITCEPITLTKKLPWYQVPSRRFHITMSVRENIEIEQYQQEENLSIAARHLTRFLQNYFTQELAPDERFRARVETTDY